MRRTTGSSMIGAALGIVLALAGPASAHEETARKFSFGVRAGGGLDPDQGVVGVQALFGQPLGFLRLAPSLDFGFGSNLTTVAMNGDFVLNLPLPESRSSLYVGAGPSFVVFDPHGGESDLQVGLNLTGGARLPFGSSNLYNLEFRYGIDDVPEFRFLLGMYLGAASPRTGE